MEMYIQGKKSGKIKSLSDAIFTNDCTMFEKVRKHKGIYLYARRNFLTYDKLLYSIYVWREATLNILYNISFVGFFSRISHTFCKLYRLDVVNVYI